MNKLQWDKSDDLRRMLMFSKPSLRKLNLFVVHCLDHNKQYLNYSNSLKSVKLLQLYADGKITSSKLDRLVHKLGRIDNLIQDYLIISRNHYDILIANRLCSQSANLKYYVYGFPHDYDESPEREIAWQCRLLRHMIKPNFKGD
jgi:hypothetical protein